jgi:aldose 1-epimerase
VLELSRGGARLLVDDRCGGRLASLTIDGFEVLIQDGDDAAPMLWGSYPMAPWAGRIRRGRFVHRGQTYQMPINLAPHAIHGTVCDRAWTIRGPDQLAIDLGPDWPFAGGVLQRFELTAERLTCVIEVHADVDPMPVCVGWHPCFVKPDTVEFSATSMYRRDDEGIPDGTLLTPPPPPPWDDCFVGVRHPVILSWGSLALRLSSDCDYWVAYDEQPAVFCVEPQSGPPDAFNLSPFVIEPGTPLIRQMTWEWDRPA